ncbi:MAG TPA: N-acetyl-gamma-glutamyl-phosphate reductase [Bacteroidia bacterium]|jgi:N-acetyl-gamma-glutamyl-phosphate reductase|nr:N-acetyl-gamma-glutamyl-phosphate reductase [Bacteroidia bacterium]
MKTSKIKAGIIGGAGYTGGETLRLLLLHPKVELAFILSKSQVGKPITSVHRDCLGLTDLKFTNKLSKDVDVLFLCLGHGESKKWLLANNNKLPAKTKIIDLSQDFRHNENAIFQKRKFIYGLPELNKKQIQKVDNIANPGCFATCIQLGLLPLAANKKILTDIHISATTGSTGAGQSLSETSHFSWRQNNISPYKVFEHQHLKEIGQTINQLQPNINPDLFFIPYRGAFTRGILATIYLESSLTEKQAIEMYKDYYKNHPFVHVAPFDVDLKQVVNTNNCFLQIIKKGEQLVIISAIDNLLKGASGQAAQNMNLMFGIDETTGLRLKPLAF